MNTANHFAMSAICNTRNYLNIRHIKSAGGRFLWAALLVSCAACQGLPFHRADGRAVRREVLNRCEAMNDTLYLAAARFLTEGLEHQYHYEGEALARYDTIFGFLEAFHREEPWDDEGALSHFYKELEDTYGPLLKSQGRAVPDLQVVTADLLTSHIVNAVDAWQQAPWRDSVDFERFCQFILPYKAGEESPEDFRAFYRDRYRAVPDTAQWLFRSARAIACSMLDTLAVFSSATLWKYPFDLPVSRIEQGRRGSCRQLVNYTASILRANGIPTAVDYVDTWGNRSGGHLWNVLLMPGDSIYPFDAPTTSYFPSVQFAYKPTKIFRRLYRAAPPDPMPPAAQVPEALLHRYDADVTDQYVTAYDVRIPVRYRPQGTEKHKYGLIAVFDNKVWKPAWWGTVEDSVMVFRNMAADVLYMGCFCTGGRLVPATAPFILHTDGRIEEAGALEGNVQDMHLERKYPVFKRVSGYMSFIKWSDVEVADQADFSDSTMIFMVDFIPDKYKDTVVLTPQTPHRYVRWHNALATSGDVAEVEFYGRRTAGSPEIRLTGRVYGYPEITGNDLHPYTHAVDGDPSTYFAKKKKTDGWVALDLGEPFIITRLRFCPRSDTNFVLTGDTYELCYWSPEGWKSCGTQIAEDQWVDYKDVPAGGLYLLHNLSRGNEERIFTYHDGVQTFW